MTDVAFHSTHRKGYKSKLFVHSKSGRCNFWGFLQYDDRRSRWWASCNGPVGTIAVALTPSWLVWISTVMPVWLYFSYHSCFVLHFFFEHETISCYTSVSWVWFLLPYVSLQSNWAWKPSILGLHCVFSLDFRLCSRYNNINYGAWHVYKLLLGSFVATCWLACSEIFLSTKEKKLERSPGKGRTWYNLAYGVTALAQLYALYSDRAHSFNQWQRALYPNFVIIKFNMYVLQAHNSFRKCLFSSKHSSSTRFDR